MKNKLIIAIFLVVLTVVLLMVFNTLNVEMAKRSIREKMVVETYMKPAVHQKIKKLKEQRDYIEAEKSNRENFSKVIIKYSVWEEAGLDLSKIREEWHYVLFDHIKRTRPNEAEKIIRSYFLMKKDEIRLFNESDQKYRNEVISLKEKMDQKDPQYYIRFQELLRSKQRLQDNVKKTFDFKKRELFEDMYDELEQVNSKFTSDLTSKFELDLNMSIDEIKEFEEVSQIVDGKYLYLSL